MRSMLLVLVSTAFIAGCTHTKETVVEKQPVVEKETVVEKPVIEKQTVVERPVVVQAEPRSCALGASSYAHGSLSCQNHFEFRCSNGVWEGLNTSC